LDEAYTELLPDEKVKKLEEIYNENHRRHKLVFVGDGINDAPVLARSDVGVAMGGIGSDAAIEAADVVIMTDEPSKLSVAIKIARKTKKVVVQNIVIALGVKFIILILGALGMANIWEAVFGDVGVALIAVLNSMRTMKF
jgi:Cd2+/Zn2+-exporting ATPase